MKQLLFKTICVLLLATAFSPARAAILWVGTGTVCDSLSSFPTLNAAILSAALNAGDDEIRLTNTVSYFGAAIPALNDWTTPGPGRLTLSGGYANCGSAQSGRALFGGNSGATFTIQTVSRASSEVTLKNIEIKEADFRAVYATGGAIVVLDNVWIHNNIGGIWVSGGAIMDIRASTLVEYNYTQPPANTAEGAGIRCAGTDSYVLSAADYSANRADKGGSIYVGSGCFFELSGGSVIDGKNGGYGFAHFGGGIHVANGGELYSNGGADRVAVQNYDAYQGAGLFITGTGKATLRNTAFRNNRHFLVGEYPVLSDGGAAIYATGGGTATAQVTMDRVATCPFLITCSELSGNGNVPLQSQNNTVRIINSRVDISRTMIFGNGYTNYTSPPRNHYLFNITDGGLLRLDTSAIINNDANYLFRAINGTVQIAHSTIANNSLDAQSSDPAVREPSLMGLELFSSIRAENSIIVGTSGAQSNGENINSISGACNLVDSIFQVYMPYSPSGTQQPAGFIVGTPSFNNLAGGDARQQPLSQGVDMCNQDSFAWSGNTDIETQLKPVNEATNLNGTPGDFNGLYDAGFDEVYANVISDPLVLSVNFTGTGGGQISSSPLGLNCSSNCNAEFTSGLTVELTPGANPGSSFVNWTSGCDQFSGNICRVFLTTQNRSVTVKFDSAVQPEEVFKDGFED